MNWYYAKGEQQVGPVSREELLAQRKAGQIDENTLVWRKGMPEWVTLREIESELEEPSGVPPLPPPQPPAVPEPSDVPDSPARDVRYAGFWIRFLAYILDGLAFMVIVTILYFVLSFFVTGIDLNANSPGNVLLQLGLDALYTTLFLGKYGATPGKMALGLQVIRADGAPISYGRAFCRYLAEFLSALILCIGYIMIAFDSEKRALHDRICETRVVYE